MAEPENSNRPQSPAGALGAAEAKSKRVARGGARVGWTLAETRKALGRGARRRAGEVAALQSIVGLLDGIDGLPTDLSERWHEYRRDV